MTLIFTDCYSIDIPLLYVHPYVLRSIHNVRWGEKKGGENSPPPSKSMNEFYPKIGFHLPWVGYFVLDNNQVVGTGGFTGPPKDGKVEIAYWTFKQFEGKGVASFTCSELILKLFDICNVEREIKRICNPRKASEPYSLNLFTV
jgi:RimJ/RimL family protein N-acetyltransferase